MLIFWMFCRAQDIRKRARGSWAHQESPLPPNPFHSAMGAPGYLLISQQMRLNRNWTANASSTLHSLHCLHVGIFGTLGKSNHWPEFLFHIPVFTARKEQVGAATRRNQVKIGKNVCWASVFRIFLNDLRVSTSRMMWSWRWKSKLLDERAVRGPP